MPNPFSPAAGGTNAGNPFISLFFKRLMPMPDKPTPEQEKVVSWATTLLNKNHAGIKGEGFNLYDKDMVEYLLSDTTDTDYRKLAIILRKYHRQIVPALEQWPDDFKRILSAVIGSAVVYARKSFVGQIQAPTIIQEQINGLDRYVVYFPKAPIGVLDTLKAYGAVYDSVGRRWLLPQGVLQLNNLVFELDKLIRRGILGLGQNNDRLKILSPLPPTNKRYMVSNRGDGIIVFSSPQDFKWRDTATAHFDNANMREVNNGKSLMTILPIKNITEMQTFLSIIDDPDGGFQISDADRQKFNDFAENILNEEELRTERLKLSTAVSADIDIPGLGGVLDPFQKAGVKYIENKNGRALLADEQGLGKCVTPGTTIWLTNGLVRIDELWTWGINDKEGDGGMWRDLEGVEVFSFEDVYDAGTKRAAVRIFRQEIHEDLLHLVVDNGSFITCTAEHAFLVKVNGKHDWEWVKSRNLAVGDMVLMSHMDGEGKPYPCSGTVIMIKLVPSADKYVYDLEVEKTHSYIANGFVTHNTVQALAWCQLHPEIKPILLITPNNTLIENWKREISIWLSPPPNISVCMTHTPYAIDSSGIVIIARHNLWAWHDTLAKIPFQLILIDEAHFFRDRMGTYPSQQTVALLGGKARGKDRIPGVVVGIGRSPIPHVVPMTGTPALNRPCDMWAMINLVDPIDWPKGVWTGEGFSGRIEFSKRYCGGGFGYGGYWEEKGGNNLEELNLKLRQTVMIRRLKEDVLKDLPEKRHADVLVSIVDPKYEERRKAIYDTATVKIGAIAKLRQLVAEFKVPLIIDWIMAEFDVESEGTQLVWNGPKLVFFGHHSIMLEKLKEFFGPLAVMIKGGVSDKNRVEAVDAFNDPNSKVKLFIGEITATGVGLNLWQSCSRVAFGEIDWNYVNNSQAEDRVHRRGQKDGVIVYEFLAKGTIDTYVRQIVDEKKDHIRLALGTPTEEAVNKELDKIITEDSIKDALAQAIAKHLL